MAAFLAAPGIARGAGTGGDHWAYRPLSRPPVPAVANARHPLDAFLAARLRAAGVEPAPEATRAEWLRRVTFDLVGLAPTPEELASFERDGAPGAHERVVDRLLASPRHGERWARHWMDAAHFAETHGHDQDRVRTHAWPYRDYLVRAFNDDVPYARFVQEQVAADVLFPERPEATAALGFVAGGPWDESSLRDIREDTTDRQVARYVDRDDMVSTVMGVFASTTVQCARCHDHKFDPVPQSDYYALQAVFAGVERSHREYHEDPGLTRRRRQVRLDLERVARKDAGRLLGVDAAAEVAAWEGGARGPSRHGGPSRGPGPPRGRACGSGRSRTAACWHRGRIPSATTTCWRGQREGRG